MGRLFTTEEVKWGRVPEVDDFEEVATLILKRFEESETIISGMIYGSFAHGRITRRSDIDCLIIYRNDIGRPNGVCTELCCFGESRYVPVNITLQDDMTARTIGTHLGGLFQLHLECAPEIFVVKKHPREILFSEYSRAELVDEVLSYLRQKVRSLEESMHKINTETAEGIRHLSKFVDSPVHVARKMLVLANAQLRRDTAKDVWAAYLSNFPNLFPRLDYFFLDNNRHTQALIAALKHKDYDSYDVSLDLLQDDAQSYLDFVRENLHVALGQAKVLI